MHLLLTLSRGSRCGCSALRWHRSSTRHFSEYLREAVRSTVEVTGLEKALGWSSTATGTSTTGSVGGVASGVGEVVSEAPSLTGEVLSGGFIAPPRSIDLGLLDQVGLNALGEPTFAALGLGHTASWWPSSVFESILEVVHVSLNVPWWTTIVVLSTSLRLVLFPLIIRHQRALLQQQVYYPLVTDLQQKLTEVQLGGDMSKLYEYNITQEHLDAQRQLRRLWPKLMMMPMAQAATFMVAFPAFRAMVDVPVLSMTYGGLLWFSDLTISDPYYALPVLAGLAFALNLQYGNEMGSAMAGNSMYRKAFAYGMPAAVCGFVMMQSAALQLWWAVGNIISLLQNLFVRLPGMRQRLGMPTVEDKMRALAGMRSLTAPIRQQGGFWAARRRESMRKQAVELASGKTRTDAVKFKEAAMGPVPKTFDVNPKAVAKKLK